MLSERNSEAESTAFLPTGAFGVLSGDGLGRVS
ncbi:unnamed protein product [Strongylus vulgaris]|uniref:Uncharacterized protein n=1 Tax=Strongylus vulgaris TaxID=40348 RepID=A0A3P7KJV9_STRVU|nr:unnamed protein product [Strongylus vulgaris]